MQLSLRFRLGSEAEEKRAIEWHANRLLKAEARCGNELACRHPKRFIEQKTASLAQQDCTADMIVAMYRAAAKSDTLDEPIWAEWMFQRNRPRYQTAEVS